jgi:iron transport multicopper oxidase
MGSPVALPLQCSQPVNFGDVAIGSTSTQIVNCTALIAITSINGCKTDDATFQCNNSTLPTGSLANGATFSFPVTWNLTQASINDAQNASFGKVIPGVASTSLDIYTTNAVAQYSNILPVSLAGKTVSQVAFLSISPPEVDFGGIVVGSAAATSGLTAAVIVSNLGIQTLTFTGAAWTSTQVTPIVYTNITTNPDGSSNLGSGFSSSSLPNVGDTLASGASVTIPLKFLANTTGAYTTFLEFWTTGGAGNAFLTGSASTAPVANISISTVEGGWDYSNPVVMNFGNVLSGTTVTRNIRICNSGGSALTITKSKPPIDTELLAPNAGVDLHEAQTIDVNSCALGAVSIIAAPLGVNRLDHTVSDVWILNTE